MGDWRLMFLNRDRIAKVTADDVVRVAKAYLKESNRTVGEFIPDCRSRIERQFRHAARYRSRSSGLQELR